MYVCVCGCVTAGSLQTVLNPLVSLCVSLEDCDSLHRLCRHILTLGEDRVRTVMTFAVEVRPSRLSHSLPPPPLLPG